MKTESTSKELMAQSRKTPPPRRPNSESRTREYLTSDEVRKVLDATSNSRHKVRDRAIVLMSYTHALRAGELIDLRWSDIDLKNGTLHVRRLKGSCNGTHYLAAEEIRLLRKLNVRPDGFVFESERGGPLTLRAVHKIVAQAGRVAEIPFPIHPHMLRHSKGYQLANKGTDTRLLQTYLGHKDIRSTTLYTQLDPSRVRGLEKNDL